MMKFGAGFIGSALGARCDPFVAHPLALSDAPMHPTLLCLVFASPIILLTTIYLIAA